MIAVRLLLYYRYSILLFLFGLLICFLYKLVLLIILILIMSLVIHLCPSNVKLRSFLAENIDQILGYIWQHIYHSFYQCPYRSLNFPRLFFNSWIKLEILRSLKIPTLGRSHVSLVLDVSFIMMKLSKWPDMSANKLAEITSLSMYFKGRHMINESSRVVSYYYR